MILENEIKRHLIIDEGNRPVIYLDSEGNKTCGIGHLITKKDPEYKMKVGNPVAPERVQELFDADMNTAISDCRVLFDNYDGLPFVVQLIVINMAFNLGRKRLAKFKRFRQAINERNWAWAAAEMSNSKWHEQLPERTGRLIKMMEGLI